MAARVARFREARLRELEAAVSDLDADALASLLARLQSQRVLGKGGLAILATFVADVERDAPSFAFGHSAAAPPWDEGAVADAVSVPGVVTSKGSRVWCRGTVVPTFGVEIPDVLPATASPVFLGARDAAEARDFLLLAKGDVRPRSLAIINMPALAPAQRDPLHDGAASAWRAASADAGLRPPLGERNVVGNRRRGLVGAPWGRQRGTDGAPRNWFPGV
ncbi:unnamed protein product [Prorocentrum cordatum]|uniref:Uncharacterized protein n=1 Tax=Prorocentrum cordatum TaxID=2364126 RepID=A0ABN9QHY2_9DINO|nr:unnamed protein product [Polarella glacialis]